MYVNKLTVTDLDFPESLKHITPPIRALFTTGTSFGALLGCTRITVVGSRKVSGYGREVTISLVTALAQAGVVIVSGLAIGVDAIAHRAALEAGGLTVAVLPGSIEKIYPGSHQQLAQRIVEQGGALVSEYPPGTTVYPVNFIARNRIAAGLGDAILITEAAEKSGTLHTARFALEQGKEVLAVPGNITSPTSAGTNRLIKAGATPVICAADVFRALGLQMATTKPSPKGETPAEQTILDLLSAGHQEGEALLRLSKLEVSTFNQALTMLEIRGYIHPQGNNAWALTH